ncbi:MAG: hypothetical protein WKF92_16745 [Pyrinomonadaceae bacterium]
MVVRAIALSLALLVGIGTIIPLATEYAEAGPRKTKRYKKKQKGYKKYSKRWWRQHRASVRKRKALQSRRRTMRLRQIRLAKLSGTPMGSARVSAAVKRSDDQTDSMLPSGQAAPKGWKRGQSTGSEIEFRVDNGSGLDLGSAAISVVGPAMGDSVDTGRNRTVGGVPTASLRREVINRMVRENGWVVNDFQKEIGGKTVYVVVAQSQGNGGRVQSRMFYFTEVDGRIYSVATNSQTDAAERLAEESEKVIFSLQSRPQPIQQAAIKE